ncbi:unnamed protein product, partial [Ilex paraguariensis]
QQIDHYLVLRTMNTLKRFTFLNKAVRSVEVYSKRQFAIDHNKNYEIASKSSEVTQTDQEKTRWRSRTEIKRTQEYAKATFIKYLRCDWECMGGMAKLAGQKKKTEVAIFEFIEMKDEKNMSDDQKKIATVYQQTLRESSVETWDFSSDAGMYINFLHQHSHARPKVYYSNSEYAELVELTFHESPD